jgi:hypothetical protein
LIGYSRHDYELSELWVVESRYRKVLC